MENIKDTVKRFNSLHYPTMSLDEVVKRLKAIGNISKDPILWDNFVAMQKNAR